MKRMFVILTLMMGVSASASAECSDAEKKALQALDANWSKAGQTGDKTTLTAIYADDYVGFPSMESKTSAIESTMRAFERTRANPQLAENVTYDHYMISCTPNTATITHRNTITRTNSVTGKPETVYSRSVHILEKRNGRWQVVSNAGHALDDAMTLRYMELDWADAIRKHDGAWLEKNYASDFTEVSFMTGDLMSRQQAIEGVKNDKSVFDAMEMSDLNIRIDGNTAIVTGIGRAKGKDAEGKPFDMRLRFTDTFIRRDGRWQAWASQATMIPPKSETAKK